MEEDSQKFAVIFTSGGWIEIIVAKHLKLEIFTLKNGEFILIQQIKSEWKLKMK